MLSKKNLVMAAMLMMSAMVAADLPAQSFRMDMPLDVMSANGDPQDPTILIAGDQMLLASWMPHSGYAAFTINPDDQSSFLFTESTLILGLREVQGGDVMHWAGYVPVNLAGYTFRARAVLIDNAGVLHGSDELNLKVIDGELSGEAQGQAE